MRVPRRVCSAPNTAPLVKLQAGEPRKTKTNSLRQQLLLGKGVVKPQDKRTVRSSCFLLPM
jgi:hypothetical protein